MGKYNVPSNHELEQGIAVIQREIKVLEQEKALFEAMLKLNEEGKYKAMLRIFDLSLRSPYTTR